MKKFTAIFFFLFVITLAHTQELNGVTFGFGAGFSKTSQTAYSYSLTTDDQHHLVTQALSKNGFVISSVLTVRLSNLKTETNSHKLLKANSTTTEAAGWKEKLAINVSLNLVEINSDNLSFNKNIDGGLGLGYMVNDFVQVALFYDLIRLRQLRDHVKDNYLGKSIPNGTDILNALDEKNNDLFYNKTFTGFSFKIILSLGSKKPGTAPATGEGR